MNSDAWLHLVQLTWQVFCSPLHRSGDWGWNAKARGKYSLVIKDGPLASLLVHREQLVLRGRSFSLYTALSPFSTSHFPAYHRFLSACYHVSLQRVSSCPYLQYYSFPTVACCQPNPLCFFYLSYIFLSLIALLPLWLFRCCCCFYLHLGCSSPLTTVIIIG